MTIKLSSASLKALLLVSTMLEVFFAAQFLFVIQLEMTWLIKDSCSKNFWPLFSRNVSLLVAK